MSEHGFEGRVAIVTGAGRGLGRAYARLLAELGATVVVNDLGTSTGGRGHDAAPATDVVTEINAAGGTAIADHHDVADAEGATALVAGAVERFGRLDALVNNAGIIRWAGPPEVDDEHLEQHLAVHVLGSFHTALAAWPTMTEQGHGRIVMTTSAGVFGLPHNLSYATAKGAVIGMSRSLALAGAPLGIKVNLIAPAAVTRMAGTEEDPTGGEMAPELVAPMVAYLAHERCPVTGEMYAAGSGRFARVFLAQADGYVHPGTAPSVDDVAEHWEEINATEPHVVPADLPAWSTAFLSHLR